MTGIEHRITDIIRDHELYEADWGVDGCNCGHRDTENHAAHVASVLVTELGLRPDHTIDIRSNNVPTPPDAERVPMLRYVTRWEPADE